jgi:hypothetical protein
MLKLGSMLLIAQLAEIVLFASEGEIGKLPTLFNVRQNVFSQ